MADKYVDRYASGAKTCYDIRCNACGTLVGLRFSYLPVSLPIHPIRLDRTGRCVGNHSVSILRGHLQKA